MPQTSSLPVITTLLPGFVGTTLPEWLEARLRAGLGGVCVFEGNIVSADQLRRLTDSIYAANPRALIALDEEGGDVTRLYYLSGSPTPGNAILGRIDDLDYTRSSANRIGWELRKTGFNLDLAPDADINSNPDNPVIGVRSFGVDPACVSAQVTAWTHGLQGTGVAACAKHFPGHGDTAEDSHLALPVIDRSLEQLRDRELVPFVAAIAAGTKSIMTSHIMLPQLDAVNPATLSSVILKDLLRGELGFDGVIVSDALDMAGASGTIGIPEAAVRALSAGCDLLCIGTDTTDEQLGEIEDAILHAVADGRLTASDIHGAASRVVELAEVLVEERAASPVPGEEADQESPDDLARATAVFEVRPQAADILATHSGELQLVVIETGANNAVGSVPWGLGAELEADPSRYRDTVFTKRSIISVTADSVMDVGADPATALIVIGRDIHRHPFARTIVDRLRAEHSAVIVVEMGWPSESRDYADVATFGASRLVGRALAAYLAGWPV
jgi:beta-N-acetylhexosaminidase